MELNPEVVVELNPEAVVESDPKQVMEFFLKLLQKEVPKLTPGAVEAPTLEQTPESPAKPHLQVAAELPVEQVP